MTAGCLLSGTGIVIEWTSRWTVYLCIYMCIYGIAVQRDVHSITMPVLSGPCSQAEHQKCK